MRLRHFMISSSGSTPRGFTLVELLTVIAIIAVLATLLTSAVTSAKKSARQARCMASLHQLSLAVDMYLDDHERRSPDLGHLTSSRYLPNKETLICPSDKTRNWAGLVEGASVGIALDNTFLTASGPSLAGPTESSEPPASTPPVERSYLTSLWWDDEAWNKLMKAGASAGVAACQLHGLGRANLESPSITDFQGLVLRARRDGAVVKRQVFWDADASMAGAAPVDASSFSPMRSMATSPNSSYPWRLFRDDADAEE